MHCKYCGANWLLPANLLLPGSKLLEQTKADAVTTVYHAYIRTNDAPHTNNYIPHSATHATQRSVLTCQAE
jgi:hypothetical protein